MKTITTTFVLSKHDHTFGKIVWQRDEDDQGYWVEGSGKISGDERAVTELTAAIEQALRENWGNIFEPRPDWSDLFDPRSYPTELLSILIRGEFDVPPEFDEWMPPPPEPEYKPDPLWDEIIEY